MSEPSQNGSDPSKVLRAEEATVTAILQSKMTAQECLRETDRQLVAYRIAEIMVAAKELYTKELPRVASEANEDSDVFGELAGLRMAFLHIRDLITDFDEAFMIAMSHQREDDDDEDSEEEEGEG
ncbi:MAG: hypothetical protein KC800_04900 [Candidatus Eremiobacteraeota bacterium]|nr:hypothetical protein [Candidatus Eremiobacteraeota bacterium]